jgi:hypothetical protein
VKTHLRELVVVQTGAAQFRVVQREAQRLDQVQSAAGIGAEPDDIAGVRRNLRLVEDDLEHGRDRKRSAIFADLTGLPRNCRYSFPVRFA